MLRVGLTGGLATGKSFVGGEMVRLGAHLLKADDLGHAVLQPGGEAYEGVVREFGDGILGPDGSIDRKLLAAAAFDKPGRLEALNALVHPAVIAREEAWFRALERQDAHAIGVVEAAILIETGSYKRFARLVLTVCTREQQIERAMKRDRMTREEAESRLQRQMPLEEKRMYAHYVIDTSGQKELTLLEVREVFDALKRIEMGS